MKKNIFILCFNLLLSTQIFSQNILWQHKAGGKSDDFLTGAVSTLDYGFILSGSGISNEGKRAGSYDYMLVKYAEDGQKEWQKHFGGNQSDFLQGIIHTNEGGYLLYGTSQSGETGTKTTANIGQFDIWLILMDATGYVIWQKSLGGFAEEKISQVIRTRDGGFLLAGSSASDDCSDTRRPELSNPDIILKETANYGNLDYWLVKLDANGLLQWQKSFGGKYKDELISVCELPDRSILLAGNSNSPVSGNKTIDNKGQNDVWLLKTDTNGNILWQKSFGDEANDEIAGMLLTKDHNVLLGGHYTYIDKKSKHNKSDIIVRKTDKNGHLIWEQTYDNNGDDFLTNVIQNTDGSIVLGAYSTSHKTLKTGKGKDDFLIIKTDEQGNEKWRSNIGTLKKEVLKKIVETRDGGYVLVGSQMTHTAKGDTHSDYYIVKIGDKDKPLHPKLPLEAIPNPAINFTQAVIGKDYEQGRMQVVDMNGKVIYAQNLNGERIVPVRLSRYPAGVYIINIVVDDKLSNSVKVLRAEH